MVPNDSATPANTHISGMNQRPVRNRGKRLNELKVTPGSSGAGGTTRIVSAQCEGEHLTEVIRSRRKATLILWLGAGWSCSLNWLRLYRDNAVFRQESNTLFLNVPQIRPELTMYLGTRRQVASFASTRSI